MAGTRTSWWLKATAMTVVGAGCATYLVWRWRRLRLNTNATEGCYSTSGVPIIDFAKLQGEAGKNQQDCMRATLANACTTLGVFYLVGHGIPDALTKGCHDVATRFFASPLSEKLCNCNLSRVPLRGYIPRGDTLSSMEREIYLINRVDRPVPHATYYCDPAAASFLSQDITKENTWPDTVGYDAAAAAEFRKSLSSYYKHMERVTAQLLASTAAALGLPEDYFEDKFDKHISNMEASFSSLEWLRPGEALVNAHVDAEVFTVISHRPPANADGLLGLEVQIPSREWLSLRYMEGALLVNVGHTLQLWTGSRFVAPVHRVVNTKPPEGHGGAGAGAGAGAGESKGNDATGGRIDLGEWFQQQHLETDRRTSRQCLAFFLHPNYDVHIASVVQEDAAPPSKGSAPSGHVVTVDGSASSSGGLTAGELARRSARRFTLVGTENSENRRAGRRRAG